MGAQPVEQCQSVIKNEGIGIFARSVEDVRKFFYAVAVCPLVRVRRKSACAVGISVCTLSFGTTA